MINSATVRILIIPTIAFTLAVLSCSMPPPSDEDLNDPSKTLQVTDRSVPSGASLYGVREGAPGTYIGTTPHVFKYLKRRDPKLFGTLPEETIFAPEDVWKSPEYYYTFQCFITKDFPKLLTSLWNPHSIRRINHKYD